MDDDHLQQHLDGLPRGRDPDQEATGGEAPVSETPLTAAQRRLWERGTRWDEALFEALQDVTIPEGLEDRLLHSVGESAGETPDTPQPIAAEETTVNRRADEPRERRGGWTRRRTWTTLAGIAAAVAVIVLVLATVWPSPANLDSRSLITAARGPWRSAVDQDGWRVESPPVEAFPLDPYVRMAGEFWQPLESEAMERDGIDKDGVDQVVVYADQRAAEAALLFVVRTERPVDVPELPPSRPAFSTGNLCVSVWQNRGRVYVLVVSGDQQDYRRLLRSRQDMARLAPPAPTHSSASAPASHGDPPWQPALAGEV